MSTAYAEKLKHPRWQKRRLEILQRDNFTCQYCSSADKTLMVHHTYYEKSKEPWEASDDNLITLCVDCHEYFHESINRHHAIVVDMMKLKLKDPFITACASDLFKAIGNLNDLVYLLWEFKDEEELLLNTLTEIFQNRDKICLNAEN